MVNLKGKPYYERIVGWTVCKDYLSAQKGNKVDGVGINLGVPHLYAQRLKGQKTEWIL